VKSGASRRLAAVQKGKPAKKYSQAGRLHDIIRLIEVRHGMTLDELAEETGVTRRTVHRDLNAIHEAGYPLVSDWVGSRKVYRFLTRFKDVPPINFSLQELMTLSLLRSQLDFLQGTPFHDDMTAIFGKINSVLPPRYAAHMERIAEVSLPLLQGRRDYRRAGGALRTLRDALIYQQRVTITYQPAGKEQPADYPVDPYTLVFHQGGLYLMGYAHNRQALRTFALERISRVVTDRERFQLPADYRPAEQLRHAFGIVEEPAQQIRVRFAPTIADGVQERIWHASQSITKERDGSIVLSLMAGGTREIIAWILAYGRDAEVLDPPALRAQVQSISSDMARRYGAAVAGELTR
jgi:predicted DNA-binding transcriptional regulator YafY